MASNSYFTRSRTCTHSREFPDHFSIDHFGQKCGNFVQKCDSFMFIDSIFLFCQSWPKKNHQDVVKQEKASSMTEIKLRYIIIITSIYFFIICFLFNAIVYLPAKFLNL